MPSEQDCAECSHLRFGAIGTRLVYGRKPLVASNESAAFEAIIIAQWLPASNLFSVGSRGTLQTLTYAIR